MPANGYVSPAEAAKILQVSRSTLYAWARGGRLAFEEDPLRFKRVDVEALAQYEASLYTAEQVAQLMGFSTQTVYRATRAGCLRVERAGSGKRSGYLLEDVKRWWKEGLDSVCVRCGILEEARADWGFLCEACVYERRTGRIYRWPIVPDRRPRAVLFGSLACSVQKGGGRGDGAEARTV